MNDGLSKYRISFFILGEETPLRINPEFNEFFTYIIEESCSDWSMLGIHQWVEGPSMGLRHIRVKVALLQDKKADILKTLKDILIWELVNDEDKLEINKFLHRYNEFVRVFEQTIEY